MSVNGVTSATQAAAAYSYSSTENAKAVETKETKADSTSTVAETGVVYEPSKETASASAKKTYKPDANLINKLKADADARTEQLRKIKANNGIIQNIVTSTKCSATIRVK